MEIAPDPPTGGRIVWAWHAWDHLVQDFDRARRDYAEVSGHPEPIDINGDDRPNTLTSEALERLRALGYLARGVPAADRGPICSTRTRSRSTLRSTRSLSARRDSTSCGS